MPDTIAAIATPAGRGGVGIVRLSGPAAVGIARRIAGPTPVPRRATLRDFTDEHGAPLDRGLVLYFPSPDSLTGEDVVELHGHGGPVVLGALLQAACAHGARPARPGEFSERAFLNGRIDLAQAEAVADLVDAASREAAQAANRSLHGEFSARVNTVREALIDLQVRMEAAIDFSDDDVADLAGDDLHQAIENIGIQLREVLGAARRGQRLREGMIVAIAGQPNVGKSTLLNRLAGTDVAIVTDIAGTTRDVLREDLVVDGLPLTVVDMAGLRDTVDPVEQEGVRRAWKALEQAELILFLVDDRLGPTGADETLLQRLPCGAEVVVVRNKCDLSGRLPAREVDQRLQVRLSAQTGAGVELLVAEVKRVAGLASGTQGLFSARTRHVVVLERALAHVLEVRRQRSERATVDLLAEELRLAQNALGEVTGAFTSEDLLGAIFSRFCIGK